MQANAFRSLRFLFSLERNRRLFKMLFTPQLFGQFIDVGHYHTELKPYYALVDAVNAFSVRMVHLLVGEYESGEDEIVV